MSRADEVRARYEAEIAVIELEEQLVAAKDDGSATAELKGELREARRVFREQRASEVAVSPETISAAAEVKEV